MSGKFSISTFPVFIWFDENLRWQANQHDGLQSLIFSADDIWYPKLDLTNAYSDEDTEVKAGTVRVYYFGMVVMAQRKVMEATCTIDVEYYPFDTQVYRIDFKTKYLALYSLYKSKLKPLFDMISTAAVTFTARLQSNIMTPSR